MTLIDKLRAADGFDQYWLSEVLTHLYPDRVPLALTEKLAGFVPANAWIDAALAIVADKLPGWKHHDYSYDADDNVYRHQYVLHHEKHTRGTLWVSESHPKSQAIALLLALLTALEGESA